jgi:predicted AlkP superfamily pyrophosphatase or phosphodiesterase
MLERIDAQVGKLVQTQLRARPDSVIAVVSDHGFASTKDEIGLFRPFIDAGLITLDKEGKVTQWDAMPWPSGGSIAIMLARPAEAALQTRVRNLLRQLQSQSVYKIASVAEREEIARMGGNPEASFYVNLAPGALAGGFKGLQSKAVGFSKYLGMHGYFPQAENMRAMFMLMGPPIPKARDLGEIDMRAIAPTLAQIMGVSMPDAEKPTVLP